MKSHYTFICLLFLIFFFYTTIMQSLHLVNTPVLGIYEKPSNTSLFVTQALYGHTVKKLPFYHRRWAYVTTTDGMKGYCLKRHLLAKQKHQYVHTRYRIKSIAGCIYPTPTVINQTIMRLPYNAYIRVLKKIDSGWIHVQLLNNRRGWMLCEDIEPITRLEKCEILRRARNFLGVPYIWGGSSSFGFDCSGLMQLLVSQMGYSKMKRNAHQQAYDSGLIPIKKDAIQPGDLVYYGKKKIITHTGICIEPGKLLHATIINHQPQVVITDLYHPNLTFRCARQVPV